MFALVLTVDLLDVEVASDELWSLGVVAVEERAGVAPCSVELWTSLGDDIASVSAALEGLAHPWSWRFETVDERVSETWRDHATVTWIADDVLVRPAWLDLPESDIEGVISISIDPGATFGMGDHPTTVLSLRALRAAMTPGISVLDVGCGSGILAVAACLFGADRADAIDISPAAVPATLDNAERNGVQQRIAVSTTPLTEMHGQYQVVVANILAPALIDLADDLTRVLSPSGSLVISGILAERHQHVLDALAPLRIVSRADLDGWTAITLRR